MKKVSKAVTCCLIANAVGLGCCLFLCSRRWAGMSGGLLDANDGPSAVSWFPTAFPFMFVCAVFNVVVLVFAVRHIVVGKGWGLMATWLAVVGTWTILQLYVRSHKLS